VNNIIENARRTAVQRYRKGKIERYAYCPKHGRKTSNYQGVDGKGMLFRCPESKEHLSHLFYANVPSGLPKTVDEIEAWKAKERQVELKEQQGGA